MYAQVFKLHSKLLKALASPRRLEIVNLLRDNEMNVAGMQEMLDLPQANLSQHLMVLREQNIVVQRKEGKEVYYQLSDKRVVEACDLLRTVLIDQHKDTDLADELVINMKDLVPVTHDPVCQMRVSPKTAGFAHKHQSKTYYFCASGCLKTFTNNPESYVPSNS